MNQFEKFNHNFYKFKIFVDQFVRQHVTENI